MTHAAPKPPRVPPPRITAIIPMHNAAATIGRTLQSLFRQSEPSWHAVIIDDGSSDRGPDMVRLAGDPRLTLITQSQAGPGAARNRGLDAATGDFIAFLDADDWLEPTAFEHLLAAALATGAARGRCQLCGPDGAPIQWIDPPWPSGTIGLDELLHGESFAIHSQLIRRDLIAESRFRTDLPCFEDSDLFIRLARRGVRWTRTNNLVCSYRLRPRRRGTLDFARGFDVVLEVLQQRGPSQQETHERPPAGDHLSTRALNYATLTLLQDDTPDKRLAASIVGRIDRPRFAANALARAAHAYLPLSEESGLDVWETRLSRYASHLRPWWNRCIREGWTTREEIAAALSVLSHLIANSLNIPTGLIDTLAPDRPVVLLGLGANGTRLAQALVDRAIPFSIRDDAVTPAELAARTPGLRAPLLTPADPFDPDAQYLMSVLDDRKFLSRLPAGLKIARWSDAVDEITRSIHSRLKSALEPMTQAHTPSRRSKRPVDLFLGSYKRPDKLAAMIESVRDTGYPARVLVAAGDPGTIEVCARYPNLAECVYNTDVNRRIGCTAPLNHVYRSLVRHDALFCTDDCIFDKDSLDIAMETLYTRFPDGDGVVGLKQENIPDGYDLAFPLMGRVFQDRFAPHASGNAIFFPGYFHLFNDAEIGLTIKCLGNWVFEPRATIRHHHPAHGGTMDSTHSHGLTHHQQDERLWCERRTKGVLWGIDQPELVA